MLCRSIEDLISEYRKQKVGLDKQIMAWIMTTFREERIMHYLKKLITPILTCTMICAIVVSVLIGNARATTCSHSLLGARYCDGAHPHAYFCYCQSCGEKVYVGGYATKQHGSGEWGSGTCPSCGSHRLYREKLYYEGDMCLWCHCSGIRPYLWSDI